MTYEDSSTKSDRSWKDLVTGWCVSEPSTTTYSPIMISILHCCAYQQQQLLLIARCWVVRLAGVDAMQLTLT